MTIYQIHETGGEWEDSYDNIVSSYLNARKAEVECQKLRIEEDKRIERARKCNNCPLCDSWYGVTERMIEATKKYCLYYDGARDGRCSNYEYGMDKAYFDVCEVEVIE